MQQALDLWGPFEPSADLPDLFESLDGAFVDVMQNLDLRGAVGANFEKPQHGAALQTQTGYWGGLAFGEAWGGLGICCVCVLELWRVLAPVVSLTSDLPPSCSK